MWVAQTIAGRIAITKKQRNAQARQLEIRRQNHITLYRSYRKGELPDIAIRLQDIIVPLQALCLGDATLASLVFCSSFENIIGADGGNSTASGPTKRKRQDIPPSLPSQVDYHNLIVKVLEDCDGSSAIVSTLFKLLSLSQRQFLKASAVMSSDMDAPPRLVRQRAIDSSNLYSGILLLEERAAALPSDVGDAENQVCVCLCVCVSVCRVRVCVCVYVKDPSV